MGRRADKKARERAEMFGTIETDQQVPPLTQAQKDFINEQKDEFVANVFAKGAADFDATREEVKLWRENEKKAAVEAAAAKKAHAFWTTPLAQYEPKLKFRFFVRIPGMGLESAAGFEQDAFVASAFGGATDTSPSIINAAFEETQTEGGDLIWYAKTVDKPSYTIANLSEGKYQSQGVMAPPRLTNSPKFAPIKMTLIDPSYPNATRKLLRLLRRTGYLDDKANKAIAKNAGKLQADTDLRSSSSIDSVGDVEIVQIDASGTTVERWVLRQAFPAEVSYGTLDYSSNDPVEISVTWNYTSFSCEFPDIGNEPTYTYNPNKDATWTADEGPTDEDILNQDDPIT